MNSENDDMLVPLYKKSNISKRNRMAILIIILGLCAILIYQSFIFIQKKEINTTINTFVESINQYDFEKFSSCINPEIKDKLSLGLNTDNNAFISAVTGIFSKGTGEFTTLLKGVGINTKLKIDNTKISMGKNGTATAKIEIENSFVIKIKTDITLNMVKVEGKWYITF